MNNISAVNRARKSSKRTKLSELAVGDFFVYPWNNRAVWEVTARDEDRVQVHNANTWINVWASNDKDFNDLVTKINF